ncbi:hypothetical protein V496_00561 [Pseudogymnoascus sp. VKM F-4515 (FW-2607)]|nr:hypothetical protein V496_00561 [Pseudogymnoascus sp. VKM F-4515 (FW-2607)]
MPTAPHCPLASTVPTWVTWTLSQTLMASPTKIKFNAGTIAGGTALLIATGVMSSLCRAASNSMPLPAAGSDDEAAQYRRHAAGLALGEKPPNISARKLARKYQTHLVPSQLPIVHAFLIGPARQDRICEEKDAMDAATVRQDYRPGDYHTEGIRSHSGPLSRKGALWEI